MAKVKTKPKQKPRKRKAATARKKAQTSPEKYFDASVRVVDTTGAMGRKSRPFSTENAVDEFRSWVYAAASLNAGAVASLPIRLYVRKRRGLKSLWPTRAVPNARKGYLLGDRSGPLGRVTPHRETMRKIMDLGDGFEEVTGPHGALEVLRDVDPWFNGFDILELMTLYLELTGNAYLHPVIDSGLGVPDQLWPMPSQWTWVVPSEENFIDGYAYGHGFENMQPFEVDEVIHFRTSNPGRDGLYYGMGKVEAGWGAIQTNRSTHEMDLALAENHARPDYAMIIKSGGSKDQLDRFEREVERKLRGTRQTGKFLSMTGDITLEPLNFPPKDLAGRDDVVEEIAAIFKTPVSLLKANDPNLASAQVGFASWKTNAILPLLSLIEQKLNERLLPLFGIEDEAVLAFDNPVPADKEFELKEHTQLVGFGIMRRNEARSERGLEPVDGGDELLVTGGLVPVDEAGLLSGAAGGFRLGSGVAEFQPRLPEASGGGGGEQRTPGGGTVTESVGPNGVAEKAEVEQVAPVVPQEPETLPCESLEAIRLIRAGMDPAKAAKEADKHCRAGEDEEVGQRPGGTLPPPTLAKPPAPPIATSITSPPQSQREVFYKAWSAKQGTQEGLPDLPAGGGASAVDGFIERMRVSLAEMAQATISRIERGGTSVGDIRRVLSDGRWVDGITELARPFVQEGIGAGGDLGAAKITEEAGRAIGFDVQNPKVQQFVDRWTVRLADEVTGYTRVRLADIVGEGLNAGESIKELTERVQEWAGENDPERGVGARAEMIARTESARAYVAGESEAWKQSDVVEGKVWLLSGDPCEFCRAVAKQYDGSVVGLSEAFYPQGWTLKGADGGTMNLDYSATHGPPLHPNCRCDILPVLKAED